MLPLQHLPAADPGPANSASGEEICRKYIWGTCNKYAQCRYRHELDIEKMKDILRFCHDYQNKNGCTRENCKFIHATKEEQNLFLATGQLPRVLAERHAAMASNAPGTPSNAETIPQIAMFISESYMQPPPAPWPPLPAQQVGLPPAAPAPPPPPPASPPRRPPALQPPHHPPPPPAPTSNAAQLRPAPTSFTTMPSQTPQALFTMNQPAVVPLEFDASRPPPPIPSHLQANNNAQLKRKTDANGNAGTSKQRKPEGSDLSEAHCENCVQRKLRIDGYKQQMEELLNEEEAQILLYKKKLQEYEIGRDVLKTIVGPELFIVFDNLIEQGAQSSAASVETPSSSFMSGSPNVSKQDLLQFIQVLFGGQRNEPNGLFEPVPSTSRVDGTLQSLTSITRRHNVASYANVGPDLAKFVMETLKNNAASKRPTVEERPIEQNNNRSNGYTANGQKQAAGASEPARYGFQGASAHGGVASYPVAGPSGYAAPAPAPAPYPMYHPAVPPPPARPPQYYPQAPGVPNMPYNGPERAAGPGPSQSMMPPAPSAAPRPGPSNAPPYNYMGRYPQPPFFPPYQ